MKRAFRASACIVLLAACVHNPSKDVPVDPARTRFSSCANHPTPSLCAEVVPRLGLFDGYRYRSASATERGEPPRTAAVNVLDDENSYSADLPPVLRNMVSPIEPWEMLTNRDTDRGYATRRINLAMPGMPESSTCYYRIRYRSDADAADWTVDTLDPRKCVDAAAYRLPTNLAAEACVSVDSAADCFADPALPASRKADLPEDFLIVVLGDSFASGEGNPDASLSDARPDRARAARWMDERCHRSAWSGGIRTGLMAVKDSLGTNTGRDARIRAGAVTVVSVACSGATIVNGLIGPYPGVKPLSDIASGDRMVSEQLDDALKIVRLALPLRSQVGQVLNLVSMQDPMRAKKSIDSVIVSVGGNDAMFAKLIELFVMRKIAGDKDVGTLDTFMREQLREVEGWYGKLGAEMNVDAVRRGLGILEPLHVMITEYPSPVFTPDGTGYRYCKGLDGGVTTAVLNWGVSEISEKQSQVIDTCVVEPLNRTVRRAAGMHSWYFVEGISAEFAKHGYCASGTAEDAYTDQKRWFRSMDDSFNYQGNLNGFFHPTWQGQRQYAERLYGSLNDSLKKEYAVRFATDGEGVWSSGKGEPTYLGRKASVSVRFDSPPGTGVTHPAIGLRKSIDDPAVVKCDGVAAGTVPAAQSAIRVAWVDAAGIQSSTRCAEGSSCGVGGLFRTPGPLTLNAEFQHPVTKRLFRHTFADVVADLKAPDVSCKLVVDGKSDAPCVPGPGEIAGSVWITKGRLQVSAIDPEPGSGVASCTWKFGGQSPVGCEVPVERLPQGRSTLEVVAADHVDQVRTGHFELWADFTPPELVAVSAQAHRATLSKGEKFVIPVWRHAESPLTARYSFGLEVRDAVSGPATYRMASASYTDRFPQSLNGGRAEVGRTADDPVLRQWQSGADRFEEATLTFTDSAGWSVDAPGTIVLLGAGGAVKTADAWWQGLAGAPSDNERRVAVLSKRYPAREDVADADRALYAGWLNFAQGSVPAVRLALKDCAVIATGVPVSTYDFLRSADACAGDKAWLADFGATLVQAGLLPPAAQ